MPGIGFSKARIIIPGVLILMYLAIILSSWHQPAQALKMLPLTLSVDGGVKPNDQSGIIVWLRATVTGGTPPYHIWCVRKNDNKVIYDESGINPKDKGYALGGFAWTLQRPQQTTIWNLTVSVRDSAGKIVSRDFSLEMKDASSTDLSGTWDGHEGWKQIKIWNTGANSYEGTYEQTYGHATGRITFSLASANLFKGKWWEGTFRSGTLTLSVSNNGNTLSGTWTTDSTCSINPGQPPSGTLNWTR